MLAMQYRFTLPADYDMGIIRQRVAEKGHALDQHSPLGFKAYLVSTREQGDQENRYAPFYLWHQPEGLRDFLLSPGFSGLTQSFGWPEVRSWPAVLALQHHSDFMQAGHATCQSVALTPFTDLAELARDERQRAAQEIEEQQALLALTVLEPADWTLQRFRLLAERPTWSVGTDRYQVLHLSCPQPLLPHD